MLTIYVEGQELYDEKNNRFIHTKGTTLVLEHSLLAVSKWESKWKKPFLEKSTNKTIEENIDYIKCMTLTQNVDPNVYNSLTEQNIKEILNYIQTPQTATKLEKRNHVGGGLRDPLTSDMIYYQMVALQIPFEAQKWHLSRLTTLIEIINRKNEPGKKMNTSDILRKNKMLNAQRRARLNTKG